MRHLWYLCDYTYADDRRDGITAGPEGWMEPIDLGALANHTQLLASVRKALMPPSG